MKSYIWSSMTALLLAAVIGCGGSGEQPSGDEPATDGGETSNTQQQTPETAPKTAKLPPADAGPDIIVATFLDTLRKGDDATAEALLTDRARIETERANLKVQPPGSDSARYAVGQVQYVSENKEGAHVSSVWEDTMPNGQLETYNVTWVLRKQPAGWRIVGLATQPAPNMPELFLNFENPQEMMAKVQQANDELTGEGGAAGQPEVRTAENVPGPPAPSNQR